MSEACDSDQLDLVCVDSVAGHLDKNSPGSHEHRPVASNPGDLRLQVLMVDAACSRLPLERFGLLDVALSLLKVFDLRVIFGERELCLAAGIFAIFVVFSPVLATEHLLVALMVTVVILLAGSTPLLAEPSSIGRCPATATSSLQ